MKLNLTNQDENDLKDSRTDLIAGMIELLIGVVLICIIFVLFFNVFKPVNFNQELQEHVGYITNIYKDNDEYYLDATIIGTNKSYTIEITKSDFIKYKTDDEISIYIKNGKAHIIN